MLLPSSCFWVTRGTGQGGVAAPPKGIKPQAEDDKDNTDGNGDQKLAHLGFLRPDVTPRN